MHKLHTEILHLLICFHAQLIWDCLICLPDILSIFSLSDLLAHPNIEEIPYLLVVALQSNPTPDNLIGFGVRGGREPLCPAPLKSLMSETFQTSLWTIIPLLAPTLGIKSRFNQNLQSLVSTVWQGYERENFPSSLSHGVYVCLTTREEGDLVILARQVTVAR